MDQVTFDEIIADSPALSAPVKGILRENAATLSEEVRQAVIDELLRYEKNVLDGAKDFLASLAKG